MDKRIWEIKKILKEQCGLLQSDAVYLLSKLEEVDHISTIYNSDSVKLKYQLVDAQAKIKIAEEALKELLDAYFLPQDEFDTSDGMGPDIVEAAVKQAQEALARLRKD